MSTTRINSINILQFFLRHGIVIHIDNVGQHTATFDESPLHLIDKFSRHRFEHTTYRCSKESVISVHTGEWSGIPR